MNPLFTLYWRWLGLPLSQAKGVIVDAVPFSFVESMVWVGLLCAAILIFVLITHQGSRLNNFPRIKICLWLGPILLIFMALGQGAFPWSLAPSSWRTSIPHMVKVEPLSYATFKNEIRQRQNHLLLNFSPDYYQSLSEQEILVGCNAALDSMLIKLGLPKGRDVQRIKSMGPLTTVLGLSYGGPAFHDPFFGELAMVSKADMPSTLSWRLIGVCHEAAHAKGFTREIDAEILTQLALNSSADIRYQLLGDIMYLRKSGERVHFPEYLRQEIRLSQDSLKQVQLRQRMVLFMKTLSEKIGFQNSGKKYGSREGAEDWDPLHPFFATVSMLEHSPP